MPISFHLTTSPCVSKLRAGRLRAKKVDDEEFVTTEKLMDTEKAPAEDDEEVATSFTRTLAAIVANPLFYVVGGFAMIKIVSMLGEQVGTILALSALPVVGLTLISKSGAGLKVKADLEDQLPELQAEAEVERAKQLIARQNSPFYGGERPKWLGPLAYEYPTHLRGEVAGDCGFDPLGLSSAPSAFKRNYECELLHARWAMLAAVGAIIPEYLAMTGVDIGEPIWWKVGAAKLSGDLVLNYAGIEGFRIAGKQGLWAIAACQVVLRGGPEYARHVGLKGLEPVGIFIPGDSNYPGSALFDPFKLAADPSTLANQAVAEIKHGRIAMLTLLGYAAQAAVTGKGPLENLMDFIADPAHNNVLAYLPK